jgi:hypothetical protein
MKITYSIILIILCYSALADQSIPLGLSAWEVLSYKGIPENEVSSDSGKLIIKVNASAGPIIHPLPKSIVIKSLSVNARVIGEINTGNFVQGQKGADDFVFRIGLVLEGNKTLNFFQKAIAPSWIKKLHSLAKGSQGVDSIYFYNVVSQKELVGQSRSHPLSKLLKENYSIFLSSENKTFELNLKDLPSRKVLALWISVDGDDTKSKFTTIIDSIRINK